MDVHRVRFIQQPTASITCFAFSRLQDLKKSSQKDDLRLAVGRSDGSIELLNPLNGTFFHETTFAPSGEDSVDSLAWTQDPDEDGSPGQLRLFSIGSSSNITEWNLNTGMVKRKNTGNFGEVWCFAAQPRSGLKGEDQYQDLVVGCGDGTVALLSTADDDLQFKRYLARVSGKKARCLTITFQKPNVVIAGFADGVMRVFDTRGTVLRTMSLGAGLPGAPKTTLIWKVLCLPNGDVVSGDSNGEIRFWDGKLYAMTQQLKGHDGDCLDLVAGNGSIFSGGVDGRIATYRASTADRGRKTWAKISHRKVREGHGPVKAMAAYDGAMSVILTAGEDSAPTVLPLRDFAKQSHRVLSRPSGRVVSAAKARLVVSWWHSTISIYKIRPASYEQQKPYQLVLKITLDTTQHIKSVNISDSGRLLAVSTNKEIKLFQLRSGSHQQALAVRKVKLPKSLTKTGARLVAISPDEAWLSAITPDNEVHVARLDVEGDKLVKVLDKTVELDITSKEEPGSLTSYESTINQLLFGKDSQILVASDVAGNLSSWVLEGAPNATPIAEATQNGAAGSDSDSSDDDDEDTTAFYGQSWKSNPAPTPPRLDSTPLILTFRPRKAHDLLAITARHQVYEFDLRTGRLTDWSRVHPSSSMPDDFTSWRERVSGVMWDATDRLWLHGNDGLIMLDLDKLSSEAVKRKRDGIEDQPSKKQKRGGAVPSAYNVAGPEVSKVLENGSRVQIIEDSAKADEDDYDFTIQRGSQGDDEAVETTARQSWRTYKYKPISAVVLLSSADGGIEMVVIERPHVKQSS